MNVDTWFPANLAGFGLQPEALTTWGIAFGAFALGWLMARLTRSPAPAESWAEGQPVIPSYRTARSAFDRELDRVRRYDRSLVVLVLKLEDLRTPEGSLGLLPTNGSAPREEHEGMLRAARHVMFWNVGYALHDLLRESDVAACDIPNRRYVVLLPESGEEMASLAAQRIDERIFDTIGVRVRRGMALYRSDGLTIEDLVAAATAACDRTAASRPASRRLAQIHPARLAEPRS